MNFKKFFKTNLFDALLEVYFANKNYFYTCENFQIKRFEFEH